jgi:DNA sulfur modification protein DndD
VFFEEVTINNVGLFRDQQKIALGSATPKKPVVLIGGLNGTGKTTLLDSIQLALYGKRAPLSNRGNLAYEEYLRRSISRGSNGNREASVAVQFRHWHEGKEQQYRVRRIWTVNQKGVAERIEVYHNNLLDRMLTETWPDFIEELLPVEIAQLFFFDGEKIESFADIETSTLVLSRAVHSLLGLSILKRLDADLSALERRKRTELKTDVERKEIENLKSEISKLDDKREASVIRRATRQNEHDRRVKALREAQVLYEKSGGTLFEQRDAIEKEQQEANRLLREVEKQIRECAEGSAPLLLVEDLLAETTVQIRREETATEAKVVSLVLAKRDRQLLKIIKSKRLPKTASESLSSFLEEDRLQWEAASAGVDHYLNLSTEGKSDLADLTRVSLKQLRRRIADLMTQSERLHVRLIDIGRKLSGVPSADLIEKLREQRSVAQSNLVEAESALQESDYELKNINEVRQEKENLLVSLIETAVEGKFAGERSHRVIAHSQRARETLARFSAAIVQRHVRRIGELIFDSFRRLLRKESLVSGLSIAPDSFELEIRGADGKSLPPDRLSAGERQLLAVSILWGLARASGRNLPVIIDTPLGRLDATHRGRIVEGYFPYASHQVVLLSTDEEINNHYYQQLKPYVGQMHHLEYDDKQGVSQVRSGYFW